jgi:hypothetical protein
MKYSFSHQILFALILIIALWNLFVTPPKFTLMSIFARDILNVGVVGLGMLNAAEGIGRVIGAFFVMLLGRFQHKGWLVITSCWIEGVAMILFSMSNLYIPSLILMAIQNGASTLYMETAHTLLLINSSDEMRGRVMGIRALAVIPMFFGSLFVGTIASLISAPFAVGINGILYSFSTIIIAFLAPRLRKAN